MELALAPLPLLNTDLFESCHSPFKGIRYSKRTTINLPFTLMSHIEKINVYNSTGQMIPTPIEKSIKAVCQHELVEKYLKSSNVSGGVIYECSRLKIYGTLYQCEQYIILPESTNSSLVLGRIEKLLCCQEYAYFIYQRNAVSYCPKTDLFIVKGLPEYDLIASHHLADYRPLEAKFYRI